MKLRRTSKVLVGVAAIIAIVVACLRSGADTKFGFLPADAEVVYSTEQHDGFLPDGTQKIKARIRAEDFPRIISRLSVTLHTTSRKYSDDVLWLGWRPECGSDFNPIPGVSKWNPSDDLSTTYVRQEGDSWEFVKYEGGFLYYQCINH